MYLTRVSQTLLDKTNLEHHWCLLSKRGKEGTPETDSKQTFIDLKYFVNDEQIYQIKVLNKCCDSARVYKAARDILKKDKKSPFTLVGGCMAHHTNIFLKDLIVKFPKVEKAIKSAPMTATTLGQSIAF